MMDYDKYRKFFIWVVRSVGGAIQNKLSLYCMAFFDEEYTSRHMTLTVGPLFACRTDEDKKLKEERQAAGCIFKPGFGSSPRSYSLAYSQANQERLIGEIKQLFPAARFKCFTSVGEQELRAKVSIPFADIIAFGQKEQLGGDDFVAEEITEYLEGIEKAVETKVQDVFTLSAPDISFRDCVISLQMHFSEISPEHFQGKDDLQPKLLMDGGYYAQIPYCDNNKDWVEKKLKEMFPGMDVDGFWSSGEQMGMMDGKATTAKTLCVDCYCPLEVI